uniref:hypothetical protein n=2 Tax=Mycobacterium sp. TaxID=1785 RepID=UPI003F9B1066
DEDEIVVSLAEMADNSLALVGDGVKWMADDSVGCVGVDTEGGESILWLDDVIQRGYFDRDTTESSAPGYPSSDLWWLWP